jgi:hypothetical protein
MRKLIVLATVLLALAIPSSASAYYTCEWGGNWYPVGTSFWSGYDHWYWQCQYGGWWALRDFGGACGSGSYECY